MFSQDVVTLNLSFFINNSTWRYCCCCWWWKWGGERGIVDL